MGIHTSLNHRTAFQVAFLHHLAGTPQASAPLSQLWGRVPSVDRACFAAQKHQAGAEYWLLKSILCSASSCEARWCCNVPQLSLSAMFCEPLTAIALSCTAAAGPAWQISSGLTQPAQAAQGTPGGRRRASLFTRTSADHGKPDSNSPRVPSGTPVLQRARASSYAGQNFGWSGVRPELCTNRG